MARLGKKDIEDAPLEKVPRLRTVQDLGAEAEETMPETQTIKTRIIFRSKVLDVSEKDKVVGARKEDPHDPQSPIIVDRRNLGWTILLEGSRERLFVGTEHPGFEAGDAVVVTIEKEG